MHLSSEPARSKASRTAASGTTWSRSPTMKAMGLRTLAFRIFDRYREAFLHDAGIAGLVLLLMAFAAAVLALRRSS